MRLIVLLLCILLSSPQVINAQDKKATKILDALSSKTESYNTISADFDFTLIDDVSDVEQTQKGKIVLKGEKFNLLLGDNRIISNGKTQWTFNKLDNEVYINKPSSGEDGTINPSKIFTVWETGFKRYYEKKISENGKSLDLIKLVPKNPGGKSYHTIYVYIDQANMQVAKIKVMGKQGQNFVYNVKRFEPNVSVTASKFNFDKSAHPGASAIDNR